MSLRKARLGFSRIRHDALQIAVADLGARAGAYDHRIATL
jgi:hypothetical protein